MLCTPPSCLEIASTTVRLKEAPSVYLKCTWVHFSDKNNAIHQLYYIIGEYVHQLYSIFGDYDKKDTKTSYRRKVF